MKRLFFAIIIVLVVTTSCSRKGIKYNCKVNRITGLSDYETENFSISNGPVDGDVYLIIIYDDSLYFKNTTNNADLTMKYDKSGNYYYATWYSFAIDTATLKFSFNVNKSNYSASYQGLCKPVK